MSVLLYTTRGFKFLASISLIAVTDVTPSNLNGDRTISFVSGLMVDISCAAEACAKAQIKLRQIPMVVNNLNRIAIFVICVAFL